MHESVKICKISKLKYTPRLNDNFLCFKYSLKILSYMLISYAFEYIPSSLLIRNDNNTFK